MSKLLVIGLDGATFDIIQPLAADGRLPNLAHIMKHGAWSTLRSTIPPITPVAWTSFFTGKNAGKHGIFDFQEVDPNTYQVYTVRTDQHREKTIWELLGEAGHPVIVTDAPFTYPPRPLNGWMITGYGSPRTPGTIITHPIDLADELPPNLRPEVKVALPTHRFERSQRFIDDWQAVMAGRRRLLRYLITERPWDLFLHVFSITDHMAHVFWTYVDPAHPNYHKPEGQTYRQAFFHGYEMCDQVLGEMMELAGPDTTTLILSDHGFGSIRPHQYVYQRLLQGGYIKPQQSGTSMILGDRMMKLAVNTYNRFPVLRELVKNLRVGARENIKKTLRRAGALPNASSFDYGRSQVIPSNTGLRLQVHEKGRFRQGIVAPDEKEALLENLSAYLLRDVDKSTGKPIIAATYRGAELYSGPHVENAPDLIIEFTNFFRPDSIHPTKNPYVEGGHTRDGIFLAYGSPIRPQNIPDASLIDLAPTMLHLLGHAVPPDFDGRVLTDALQPGFLQKQPVTYGSEPARRDNADASSGFSDEEEAELREQLRQLGYIS